LRRPWLLSAAGILVAAGVGVFLWVRHDPSALQYRTVAATLGTVTQTVSLSGNLAPVDETDLDFGGSGRVGRRMRPGMSPPRPSTSAMR